MINLSSCIEKRGVYYCEDGDTLSSVAKKFSTTPELLAKDNGLTGEISKGDLLIIVKHAKVYTVRVEDTPQTVAEKLGITVEKLFEINKTKDIYPFMQVVCD